MELITLADAIEKRQRSRNDAALSYFSEKTVALYADKQGRKVGNVRLNAFCVVGSGVLVNVSGKKFLLTAGHVLEHVTRSPLWIFNNGYFESFGGAWRTVKEKDGRFGHGPIDFAWIELDGELSSKIGDSRFVPEDRIFLGVMSSSARGYTVIGYPSSKNKKFFGDIKVGAYSYTGEGVVPEKNVLDKYYCHVFAHYDKKFITDKSGALTTPIKIDGVSGGSFIDLGNFNSPKSLCEDHAPLPTLAGIMIEYLEKHRLLVGMGMKVIIDDIKNECGF